MKLECKTSKVTIQKIITCDKKFEKVHLAGKCYKNSGSMDLRIIPGKEGKFELEDFALKEINEKNESCEFYIHSVMILRVLFVFLLLLVNN